MQAWAKGRGHAAGLAAAALVAAGLAGCATMPPEVPFTPDNNPDRAALTIFRERQFENGAFDVQVRIDRKSLGVLSKKGGVLTANAAPGELNIAVQSEYDFRELALPLHAEAGHDYYIDVLPRVVWLAQFGPGVYGVPKDKEAVARCNLKWCIVQVSAEEAKAKAPK